MQKTSSWNEWNAQEYLSQYYKTAHVAEDEEFILKYLIDLLKKENRFFNISLEVGCGPTIHHSLPLFAYVDKIILSDYIESNIDEIKKWFRKDPDAQNWDIYIQYVLEKQQRRGITKKILEAEKDSIYKKNLEFRHVDIYRDNPLGVSQKFPLVTSFYCADSVANTKAEWEKCMENIHRLVDKNGLLVVSALHKSAGYKVGKNYFPSPNIDDVDMYNMLLNLGFKKETINVQSHPIKAWQGEGFNGIIIAHGYKN